jgi:nitrous oxidase accessory protein
MIKLSLQLILFLTFIFFKQQAYSNTIKVGPSQKIKLLSKAVELANSFDTILVDKAVYFSKNLEITKPLVFIGIDYPIIDGESKYQVITIRSSNVIFQGFKIQHSSVSSLEDVAGIKIINSKNVIVRNNILDDTFFGIYSQYSQSCLIENNTLVSYRKFEQEAGNGIHCWKSDSIRIINNKITGHRDGIYLEFVTNSVIWRNSSIKNIRYGLHFMFSHNDSYISNIFKNNGAGVAVMFTRQVKMFNNFFEENWGDASYGLLLKEISDSYIQGNIFQKNTIGIHMEGTSRIVMKKNQFISNGFAIQIQASCDSNTLSQNNFISNTFDIGTNGSLVLNNFNGNYWDKYEGYDLNKDKIGDIPYRPISMFSMIVEKYPTVMILFRSFMVTLLDKTEKILPSLTPENLKDNYPLMKAIKL